MKKFVKSITFILAALMISISFAACDENTTIIGKWEYVYEGELITMEFEKDHMVIMSNPSARIPSTYSIDGDKLTITMAGIKTYTYTYKLKENNLILIDASGESIECIRK